MTAAQPSGPTAQAHGRSIAMLFGGPSAEHDVSIVSGSAIADALEDRGHAVRRIYLDLDGGWWWLPADHGRETLPPVAYDDPAALGAEGPYPAGVAVERLAATTPRPVVFVALHGPFGEDGTVQALLEAEGLAYTGAGITASAVGMDKAVFKRLVSGLGIPVVAWMEVRADRWAADRDAVLTAIDTFARSTGDVRLMMKPARLGSSVGMTIAHDPAERVGALEHALAYDSLVLVERYLPHPRELEVSVLGNDPQALETFGPGEIFPGREFYDYIAKYVSPASHTVTRAEVTPDQRARIHELARTAYVAIGAEGFARVDFFLSDGQLYLNEINTIPGFTPISLFPTMTAEGGYGFADICERIVDLAVERHAGRPRRRLTSADLPRGGEPA